MRCSQVEVAVVEIHRLMQGDFIGSLQVALDEGINLSDFVAFVKDADRPQQAGEDMGWQHDSVAAHQEFEYAEGVGFELGGFEVKNGDSVDDIGESSQLYAQIGAFLSASIEFSDFSGHAGGNKLLNHGLVVVLGPPEGRGESVELDIADRVDVEEHAGQNQFIKFI